MQLHSVICIFVIFLAQSIQLEAQETFSAKTPCVFNSTHCSCRLVLEPGVCLRNLGVDCIASRCSENGYTCDCSGQSVCKIKKCPAWVSSSGIPTSMLPVKAVVPCQLSTASHCLEQVREPPAPSPQPEPTEYRMIQFGKASPSTLFNLSAFVDEDDFIARTVNLHGVWTYSSRLRPRFITMRMIDSADLKSRMLCAIFNSYGIKDDGLGSLSVQTEIWGDMGQTLTWVACDDTGECQGNPGTYLKASHNLVSTLTDGWCVSPLEWNGNAVRVKFSGIKGMAGIVIQAPAGQDQDYLFADGQGNGMTGTLDDNGLIRDGSIPDITFKLAGIEVPRHAV